MDFEMGSHSAGSTARPQSAGASEKVDLDHVSLARQIVDLITKVGSPIAVGTALLFYFGWTRADAQARALGYDVTLLGLTTSDYVLRSINVLFLPLILLLLGALAGYLVHPLVVRSLQRRRVQRPTKLLVAGLRLGWLWFPVLSLVVYATVPASRTVIVPIGLAAGILIAIYGDRLDRHLRQLPPSQGAVRALTLILLAVVVFWGTERTANLFGRQFAEYIAAEPKEYAQITLFSPKRLELAGPEIKEQMIGTEESAYRYRYDGLRLLLYSNSKYFLLAYSDSRPKPSVVVIPDNEQLRVEFTR